MVLKSFHAPGGRENEENIKKKFNKFKSLNHLDEFINALPYPVLVLNSERQIIFSNRNLIKKLNAGELSDFLGKRIGETLNCIHSKDNELGCGTSEHCKVCGAVNTILKSQKEKRIVTDDCHIISEDANNLDFHNFEVSATPFQIDNENFTIFSMTDNTSLKKKAMLERLFFHDILNTAGNLKTLSDLAIKNKDEESRLHFLKMIEQVSIELLDEIKGQKSIAEAENNELFILKSTINSGELLNNMCKQFKNYEGRPEPLFTDPKSENINFISDKGLTSRILKNMIKNALEATNKDQKVKVTSALLKENILFRVDNAGVIPENARLQIFQKNFSTKSPGRGFGTYSMKLLGEKYLGGKVYFRSSQNEGTSFFLELPLGKD